MNKAAIVLSHKLHNRVRFKLSLPLKDAKETGEFLTEYKGIKSFEYNNVTRSVLIYFNPVHIDLNEVMMRLCVSYSKQYDMQPINIFIAKSKRKSSLAYFSIANIAIAVLVKKLTNFKSDEIVNFLSWSAVGTTALAILDHGYREVKEQGAFDPELVSSVYLVNAVRTGKPLTGSFITWLAAFGRHTLDLPYEGITVKVKEFKNIFTGEPQYNINTYRGVIVDESDLNGKISIFRDLISKYIDNKQVKIETNYFMGNDSMLATNEVGASELIGSPSNITINNNNEKMTIL